MGLILRWKKQDRVIFSDDVLLKVEIRDKDDTLISVWLC